MMRRSTRQSAVTFTVLVLTAAAGGQVIRLRARATVSTPVVRLADVAEIEAADPQRARALGEVLLSRAPRAGAERRVSLQRVAERLAHGGEDLSSLRLTGSRTCVISRGRTAVAVVSARLTAAAAAAAAPAEAIPLAQRRTLEEAIRRFLTARAHEHAAALHIEFQPTDRMLLQLSESAGRFVISARSARSLGEIPLTVLVPVADGEPQQLKITPRTWIERRQVVARRGLPKGRLLTADDVQATAVRVTRPDDRVATRVADVIGSAITTALAAGEPVRIDSLKRPALIRRGEAVTVTYRHGSLKIRTIAWAAEDGMLGDHVKLRRSRRGKETFSAVCTGARSAQIDRGEANKPLSPSTGSQGERG